MLKNREAEASTIALIVAVVIGLIIIVVIIAIMSGKLGSFSKGGDNSVFSSAGKLDFKSCAEACTLIGKVKSATDETDVSCITINPKLEPKVFPGSYTDVGAGKVCCCENR